MGKITKMKPENKAEPLKINHSLLKALATLINAISANENFSDNRKWKTKQAYSGCND